MLSDAVVRAVDEYWAGMFGCDPESLRNATLRIAPHGNELSDYQGVYLLHRRSGALLVSHPAALPSELVSGIAQAARNGLVADSRWSEVLGLRLEQIIGPAWIGYADAGSLRTAAVNAATRVLTPVDAPLVDALSRACTAIDWAHGGGDPAAQPAVGAFAGDNLAAMASYEIWGERIAHIAVVTHPAHRSCGFGRAAVSALAALALERGLFPQYRTLESNAPSRSIADALGFKPYAVSLALRLREW